MTIAFPWPGRERVRRAPEEGEPERDEDDADAELFLRDQAGEPVFLSGRRRRVSELGWPARKRARPKLGLRRRDVERLREQVVRIRAELVADAGRRNVGGEDAGAAFAADDELAPADAVRVVRVLEANRGSGLIGLEDGLEAERGEAARAGPGANAGREDAQCRRSPVDLELEAACDLLRESLATNPVALLIGGDLGQVEDVLHVDTVAGSLDRAVAVDREVPERMRLRRRGDGEGGEEPDEQREALHDAYLRATGLQRSEKCGLRRSARPNQSRADAWLPRQRSIIPRWKYLSASRVPSRSARFE